MGTKIILDDAIAGRIERISQERQTTFQEVLNLVLKEGITRLEPPRPGSASGTEPVSAGGCLLESLDDVAGALAEAEGEAFK